MNFAKFLSKPPPGEEIVISGISGKFPLSDNMRSFQENLYDKVDMVTDDKRWRFFHPDMPERIGKVNRIEKFDPGFFGTHAKEADVMEPMYRGLMEKVLEAIYDAGVNPKELEGTKTGVYLAVNNSDCQGEMMKDDPRKNHYTFTGLIRCVLPNRISYHLKLNGPSFAVDTGCSSALFALNEAYIDMRTDRIENAIIGATTVHLHPVSTLQYAKLGALSADGACKSFDDSANGYARSEAISAILLQKQQNARRIYSTIVHCRANSEGYKDRGITYPSSEQQQKLLNGFYEECGINPASVDYVEPHGTGTSIGDFEELQSVAEIFCKQRSTPLPIGSIKSNMGHAEAGAAICQIAKAILIMEIGLIPPNLHFKTPRKGIEALGDGRIQVVDETTPFRGDSGLIAINSFGMGGSNSHLLLKWNDKVRRDGGRVDDDEALRLVCVSGRVNWSIEAIFDQLAKDFNVEFVGLLHQLFKYDIPNHHHRGFAIVAKTGKMYYKSIVDSSTKSNHFDLMFGDVDEDFSKCLLELLDLPMAREIFQRIECVLANEKFKPVNNTNNLSAILTTTTMQIIIFEILKTCNVVPKLIRGVGFGKYIEMYAKGYLTLEETISSVYFATTNPNKKLLEYCEENNNHSSTSLHVASENIFILPPSCKQENFLLTLLKTIGRLYELGYNPQLQEIYPKVNFPVSRGTPMISPLVHWNHKDDWSLPSYGQFTKGEESCERVVAVDVKENEWKFIAGHVVDGRNLFPGTGYLYMVWETFAAMNGKFLEDMDVAFENVCFMRATKVPKDGQVVFSVSIRKASGFFEILENNNCIVSGRISSDNCNCSNISAKEPVSENGILAENDFYKELRIRGYHYTGLFKSVRYCTADFRYAGVEWHNNWITFIDNVLQLHISQLPKGLFVIAIIKKIVIKPNYHLKFANRQKNSILPVYYHQAANTFKSGGIKITGLTSSSILRKKPTGDLFLEKYVFIPNETSITLEDSIRVNMQIILENLHKIKITFVEIEEEGIQPLTSLILNAFSGQPLVQAEALMIQREQKMIFSECLLVVGFNLLQHKDLLKYAFKLITPDGFVLSREASDSQINNELIEIITVHKTTFETLYLFKKRFSYKIPTLLSIDSLGWFQELQNLIKNENDDIIICSQNNSISGILGFVNCLRKEPKGAVCRCLSIQDESAPMVDLNLEFYRKQLSKRLAINVYKDGQWGTYRHLLLEPKLVSEKQHAFVEVLSKGNLSTLKWVEGPLTTDENVIRVYYAALNFKDVMTASGRIQNTSSSGFAETDFLQGLEFSGRSINGKRVMGLLIGGALSTLVKADEELLIPVPDEWTLEEAATVPVVYLTVLYALIKEGKIRKGQSILIHSGAGGIGQAAINIASHYGLEIFTTVGTAEKKSFVLSNFPHLKETHIGCSRTTDFEQMIQKETKGKGVDIVLNSLAEEKLHASLRCVAKGGKFLEIGKFDLLHENPLSLEFLNREVTFHGVHMERLVRGDFQTKKRWINLLKNAIKVGLVKPLPRMVYETEQVEEAFRFMASGNHVGKVLIKIQEEEDLYVPNSKTLMAIERYYYKPEGCCVITGGLGGFGLELVDWLIKCGARKFLLSSRLGIKNSYQALKIKRWKDEGVEVKISKNNITTKDGCEQLLEEANRLGPVTSIFHLAVVLSDALFENQTEATFKDCFAPKADAAKHLDELSRILCPHLRDFVVFSSVCCGRGNGGQTNYGMANSVMERICEERRKVGLPGLAIQWGMIGDVGVVAEMHFRSTPLEVCGTLQQSISSCLQVLNRLLVEKEAAIVSSIVIAEKKSASGRAKSIVEAVANLLGIRDLKTISMHATLAELGMDSLLATEIRQVMERELEIFLTMKDVRALTFAQLHEIMSAKVTAELQSSKNLTNNNDESDIQESTEKVILRLPSSLQANEKASSVYFLTETEGFFDSLAIATKNLSFHCFCLQFCTENFKEVTMTETAVKLLNLMEDEILKAGTFGFIAYSMGCLVALEMTALLERHGIKGNVILIDGVPKKTIDGASADVVLEKKLQEEVVETLKEDSKVNNDYKSIFKMGRMKAVHNYQPAFQKISSNIVLYRPTNNQKITEASKN